MLTGTLLVFVVALILELVRRRLQLFRYFEKRGIPGPKPHFLWGHYHLLREDHTYWMEKWAKEYGDTFGVFWGDTPMLISSDLDLQQKVLVKEFSNFVNRAAIFALELAHPMLRTMLTLEKDSRWKNLRSVITPSFSSSRMKAMTPLIVKGLKDFETNLRKQGSNHFDVYPLLKRLTMDNIGRTAFGIEANTQADPTTASPLVTSALEFINEINSSSVDLVSNSFRIPLLNDILCILFRFNLLSHPCTNLGKEAEKIVKARRHAPKRNDLLQAFLDNNVVSSDVQSLMASGDGEDNLPSVVKSKKGNTLTDYQVMANTIVMFVAGYETTSTGLSGIFHCLATHPEIQSRLRQEIVDALGENGTMMEDTDKLYTKVMGLKYLDQCVSEALRLFPPVTSFTTRTALKTTEYKGIKLEPGLGLVFPTRTVHHDERYWPDPLTYNPERFAEKPVHPLAYQAFGDGPRNCVGMRLALLQIKLILCHILPKMNFVTKEKMNWKCRTVISQPETVRIGVEAI